MYGNLVYNRAGEVMEFDISNYCGTCTSDPDIPINLVEFEPIPLSGEWLERIGFLAEIDYAHGTSTWELKIPSIAPNGDNVYNIKVFGVLDKPVWGAFVVNDFWASRNIYFVHELQNLYRAITGDVLIPQTI